MDACFNGQPALAIIALEAARPAWRRCQPQHQHGACYSRPTRGRVPSIALDVRYRKPDRALARKLWTNRLLWGASTFSPSGGPWRVVSQMGSSARYGTPYVTSARYWRVLLQLLSPDLPRVQPNPRNAHGACVAICGENLADTGRAGACRRRPSWPLIRFTESR